MALPAPTKERPHVLIPGGPLLVMRGYEVIRPDGDLDFLGSFDGPTIKLAAAGHHPMLIPLSMIPDVIAALQAQMIEPEAAAGVHDAEMAALGFTPVPR